MNYQVLIGSCSLENCVHVTYGIKCRDIAIGDVSPDKAAVERLVSLCNELELDPIHINDVIDDFLGDWDGKWFH